MAFDVQLGPLLRPVQELVDRLNREGVVSRIWRGDPSVWGGTAETPELTDRLGWLDPFETTLDSLTRAGGVATEVGNRFDRVVLLGMGGSSLAPEVIWRTMEPTKPRPDFVMLDSTSPDAIVSAVVDLGRTCFVVSSKSGSTIETRCLLEYFWARTGNAGDQFFAVTDPGSQLERFGRDGGFRHVFTGEPSVGGRFSALTVFGLAPMQLAGLPVADILERGRDAARNAIGEIGADNPAAWLGAIMGGAVLEGRNKLGLILSPAVASLGLWLEQLIAESTGKQGSGVIPVPFTNAPDPEWFGDDWLFVSIALPDEQLSFDANANSHPSVSITLPDTRALGAEFFRWEFATAVAGAVLGCNPFDQPNVAESKANTSAVLSGERSVDVVPAAAEDVEALLADIESGDYLSLLWYAAPTPERTARMERVAARLRQELRCAVTVGFGPRYLHSTGQLHKGGPAIGSFVQIVESVTGDPEIIPGQSFSFGQLIRAQADGDYLALSERGRPVLRVEGVNLLEGGAVRQ